MTLYDFVARCEREKCIVDLDNDDTDVDKEQNNVSWHSIESGLYHYQGEHPLANSHKCRFISKHKERIPNFVGATLPRSDKGDREYYFLTMLVLFKPWRKGYNLKQEMETWEDAFEVFKFSPRHSRIIKHINIRHECLDAADDYAAQLRAG
ncbi:hypothetical protein BDN72DRAFT_776818, partial [Pluteus cervinus]